MSLNGKIIDLNLKEQKIINKSRMIFIIKFSIIFKHIKIVITFLVNSCTSLSVSYMDRNSAMQMHTNVVKFFEFYIIIKILFFPIPNP